MASKTQIANMALSHISEGTEIQNILTDTSSEAVACRRFFDIAVETVLRDFDWAFARVYAAFNLVEANPTLDWGYSYRVPADCVAVRRIQTGIRRFTAKNVVPFDLGNDSQGQLVYCDMASPLYVKYTKNVTNTAFFSPDFTMALAYYLALLILPRLSAGDPYKRGPKLANDYAYHMGRAKANSANESQSDMPVEAEGIRGRESVNDDSDSPRR